MADQLTGRRIVELCAAGAAVWLLLLRTAVRLFD